MNAERAPRTGRGAVLAVVVAVGAVMMLLALAAFMYFRSNAGTAVFQRDRIFAEYAAESGVQLALHHLKTVDELPREFFEPFSEDIVLPEGSAASVRVVPFFAGEPLTGNGAVEIRSRGTYRSQEYRIIVRAIPRYLSGFALVTDSDIPNGFFAQGAVVDGPVHANGIVFFDSTSPDSTGDPWIESVSTTGEGGFYFSDTGYSTDPHPPGSRTWVRPWPRHNQGRPFWSPDREPVDMASAANAIIAASGGAVHIAASRILLDGNRLLYRTGVGAAPETLSLAGVHILTVSGGYGGVVVKSTRPLTAPLTIVSMNDMVIGGTITGAPAGLGGPLGLVAMGDIVIETDPELLHQYDWEPPWDIETASSFVIRASLAAPRGTIRARRAGYPTEAARLTVHGSLAVAEFSWTPSGTIGHSLGIAMDQGLKTHHPPGFPQVWKWEPTSWDLDVSEDEFEAGLGI